MNGFDTAGDPHDLSRFVEAQVGIYERALSEIRAGRKRSHWMWFIFPQLRGLGSSSAAQFYGIASLDEAAAYLAHPVLGTRLRECVDLVLATSGRTAVQILGTIDAMKFRSSLTLFEKAAGEERFAQAIERFYGGERDPKTVQLLSTVA